MADPMKFGKLGGQATKERNQAKSHCPRGHPYFGTNLYVYHGERRCVKCSQRYQREFKYRKKSGFHLVKARQDGVRMKNSESITITLYYHEPPMYWHRAGSGYWTIKPEVTKKDFIVTGSRWGRTFPRFKVATITPQQEFDIIGNTALVQFCGVIHKAISDQVKIVVSHFGPDIILPARTH